MPKHFSVDARAMLTWGRESIKDHTTAVLELVKNSYDAAATIVEVQIWTNLFAEGGPHIRIVDDGVGMSATDVENNWLRLGYSAKREDRFTARGRRRTGEKGVGRISADRLGCRLSLLWYGRATYSLKNRNKSYYFLLNVGRWLGKVHPEITSPADWTRALAAEAVSVVCQWHGGDWCSIDPAHVKSRGQILAPNTRAGRISILRVFFRDLQEGELIPRRFDPMRSMVTPKSLLALIGPNPRAIADDVWAKLIWAGLNLTVDDLPEKGRSPPYPVSINRLSD
jgi:hypothetical protein